MKQTFGTRFIFNLLTIIAFIFRSLPEALANDDHLTYRLAAPYQNPVQTEEVYLKKEGPQYKTGNLFYNSTNPDQLLFRANIWGAVSYPGIHYLPKGTTLLDAVSIAGGPVDGANSDQVVHSTIEEGKTKVTELSLNLALAGKESNPILKPGDVVVIKRDESRENIRTWLGVGSFVLSVFVASMMVVNLSNQ